MSKFEEKKILIRKAALPLFNESGIEGAGMRDIAAKMGMHVGNITYYYHTKEDLILDLVRDLAAANSRVMLATEMNCLEHFAELYANMFSNHYQYRCLIRSQVMINQQYEKVVAFYRENAKNRYQSTRNILLQLISSGIIEGRAKEHIDSLVQTIAMVSRFWLQESWLNGKNPARIQVRNHYVAIQLSLLEPYVTKVGKAEFFDLQLRYTLQL
jgi:AcrR family transcriptional regulator